MRGSYLVVVRNNKVQIKLTISRNLTILQGNSATGKTTLVDLVAAFDEYGEDSGAVVNCDVPCKVLSGRQWERDLASIENSIVFVDEDSAFMKTHEFAHAARCSSNYYVLVARESLPQLPYSVDEIFGLRNNTRSTTKYPVYSRTYASTYRIYGNADFDGSKPDVVVVEDSNSGFEFFSALCQRSGIPCVSAGGKAKIYDTVLERRERNILVIADGAAFGPEMEFLVSLQRFKNIQLYLPESFEWLVLRSGLFPDKQTQDMLNNPAAYIDSERFFSWEQFFTHELLEVARGTYLAYSKSKLNDAYLGECARQRIEGQLPQLGLRPGA